MSERTRGWALAAWAAAVDLLLVLNVLWPLPGREADWPWVMGLMAFPVTAALLLARRPGNTIGRLLGPWVLVELSTYIACFAARRAQSRPAPADRA